MDTTDLPSGPDQLLLRVAGQSGDSFWVVSTGGECYAIGRSLCDLCTAGVDAARALVAASLRQDPLSTEGLRLLAPVDPGHEVWAAGVTYERSRTARIEESGERDLYSHVYESARPELFFKAVGRRAVGPGSPIGIRRDAHWSVPEPELAVAFDGAGQAFGFVVGDDVSSRDIEAANALYLPQAKVYDNSCALGPALVPVWALPEEPIFSIELQITRQGATLFSGSTSTEYLRRHWRDLSGWLRAGLSFPEGVILLTGTGIVPGDDVSLAVDDDVTISISDLGTLRNRVVVAGDSQ